MIISKYKIKYKDVFHVLFFSIIIIIKRLNVEDFADVEKIN